MLLDRQLVEASIARAKRRVSIPSHSLKASVRMRVNKSVQRIHRLFWCDEVDE